MNIYFDENTNIHLVRGIQQLQKGLNQKEAEPVEIFFLPDEFGKGVADEAWIPKLGEDQGRDYYA